VAVERKLTMPHGGYEGGGGWKPDDSSCFFFFFPVQRRKSAFSSMVLQRGGEDGELKNNDPWQCWCVCISLPLLQSFSIFPQFSSCSKMSPLFSFLSFPCLSLKTKNCTSRPPSTKLPPYCWC
jgi:hypothetical protein